MFDPAVIYAIQLTALFMGGVVILYLFCRIRDLRKERRALTVQIEAHRKETEESQSLLRQSAMDREWYRLLFCHLGEMAFVYSLTRDGRPDVFLEVSEAACSELGYSRDELVGKTLWDIQETPGMANPASVLRPEGGARATASPSFEPQTSGIEKRYDTVLVRKNGDRIPAQISLASLDIAETPVIMAVAHNTTALLKSQEALRETERRLRDFFSSSPFGMAIYDADKKLIQVNNACRGMFGIPDEAAFGKLSLLDWPGMPDEVRQKTSRGEWARYTAMVRFEELVEQHRCATTRKGTGHFDMTISYMGYDKNYRPRGWLVHVEDVTERKKVEADLRRMADRGSREGTTGSLADMGFTDMIQILCAGGRTVKLDLKRNGESAAVYIGDGAIAHCETGTLQGESAFYDLMRWRNGTFSVGPCPGIPMRTIQSPLMSLLMEGARLMDEGENTC